MSSVNVDVQIQTKFCQNECSLRCKYTVETMISPVQSKYVSANEAVYLTFPRWVTEPDVRHCEYEIQRLNRGHWEYFADSTGLAAALP